MKEASEGFRASVVSFFENLFYRPRWYHWVVAMVLLPFSVTYGMVMMIRRRMLEPRNMGIPIVSVGNLLIGGSGKTPMTIALAKRFDEAAVVLRGYGRESSGVVVVSRWGDILCDVRTSGDEAMLLAHALPKASVIVAEDRLAGIREAKALGAKVVFLDDGFSKVGIEKFDLLLFPAKIPNPLPLPSGPFREFSFERKKGDLIAIEGKDFVRKVTCEGCDEPMLLVTAIARPERLEPYLPQDLVAGRYILPDHAWFEPAKIRKAMKQAGVEKILTTEKDWVKLKDFGIDGAVLKLDLEISERLIKAIENHVRGK